MENGTIHTLEDLERFIAYPTRFEPELPPDATHEQRLQYYTGVVVKVRGKEYAIAPAGEGRVFFTEERPA